MQLAWTFWWIVCVICVLTIVSAWVVQLRNLACLAVSLAEACHLILLLWLTAVRFSAAGRSCAVRKGLAMFRDDGLFLKAAIATMWASGWLHCVQLCWGNVKPNKATKAVDCGLGDEGK